MSVSHGLSDEEFQRMQEQLLELRTSNYQLKDQCRKYETEFKSLKSSATEQAKELEKATKAVSKSKKAKEVETLLNENESLQRKLQSQEEDFRIQNSTLIEELSKLCASNEELEKKLAASPSASVSTDGSTEDSKQQDETRQLQAMNAALQKNLTSTQEQFQSEISDMQTKINFLTQENIDLKDQCSKLLGDRPAPTGASEDGDSSEIANEPQTPLEKELHDILSYEWDCFIEDVRVSSVTSDFDDDLVDDDSTKQDPVTVLQGHAKQLKTRLSGALLRNVGNLAKLVNKEEEEHSTENTSTLPTTVVTQNKELTELQLRLDTEREEKNLIKEQMQQTEQLYKGEIAGLKEEIEKLTEKVKKKQESIVQLQNEKEQQFSESRQQLDDMEENKNRDIESLRREQNRLHGEIAKMKENTEVIEERFQKRIKELEDLTSATSIEEATAERLTSLHTAYTAMKNENIKVTDNLSVMSEALAKHLEDLKKEKELSDSLRAVVEERELTLTTTISERDDLKGQLNDLQGQHNECLAANSKMSDQLREVQNDRNNLHRDLAEAHKLADNRKTMLDDLAIQTQTLREQHKEEIKRLQETHQGELEELTLQLQEEKKRRRQLEPLQDQMSELRRQMESVENAKGWFERSFKEAEEHQARLKEEHQEEIMQLKASHDEQCESLRIQIEEQKGEVIKREQEIKEGEEKCQSLEETISQMEVAAKDVKADQKLNDKKLHAKTKDLQRQVKQEKKRADKLQERLQEIITHGIPAAGGLETLLMEHNHEDRQKLDSSSISSLGTGTGTKDASDHSPLQERVSNTQAPNIPTGSLSEETTELISRLTEIQQENWRLEEKVRHLEESNSCMAEDLLRKSAIIETHVMGRKLVDPGKNHASPAAKRKSTAAASLNKVKDFMTAQSDGMKDMNQKQYPGKSHASPAAEKKSTAAASLNKLKDFMTAPSAESDGMKDMNQKLQIMLEETLTKNLHLQKDIEMLSSEVVRLSRLVGSSSSSSLSSPVETKDPPAAAP